MTTQEIDIDILKALALKRHLEEPFFEFEGQYYEGTRSKSELVPPYDENDYNKDYMVLTDEEADEKAKEYITETLWAFNPGFLADMTDFDIEIFKAIRDNGKCEDNNDVLFNTIKKTCGIDTFVEAAIQADGRGHFMSSYDGNEYEEEINGETFYIYRLN